MYPSAQQSLGYSWRANFRGVAMAGGDRNERNTGAGQGADEASSKVRPPSSPPPSPLFSWRRLWPVLILIAGSIAVIAFVWIMSGLISTAALKFKVSYSAAVWSLSETTLGPCSCAVSRSNFLYMRMLKGIEPT